MLAVVPGVLSPFLKFLRVADRKFEMEKINCNVLKMKDI